MNPLERVAEHARKWADLPVIGPVVSALFPVDDGDIAQLEELADRIFAAASGALGYIPPGFIYQQAMDATWIDPVALLMIWDSERDPVTAALVTWKAEIDGIAA